MSKKHNHIEHLTPGLIRAYREGRLNGEEMHQVEQLLLKYELFEEAMEGLDTIGNTELLEEDLSELDSRIDSLLEQERPNPLYWTTVRRMAAVVLLAVVAFGITQVVDFKPTTKELTELQKSDSRESQADSLAEVDKKTTPLQTIEPKDEVADEEPNQPLVSQTAGVSNEPEEEIVFEGAVAEEAEQVVPDILRTTPVLPKTEAFRAEIQASPVIKPERRMISGQVYSVADSSPLKYVTVLENNSTNGISTDEDGRFSLSLEDPKADISFQFLGFETKTVSVGDTNFLRIGLEPQEAELDEIVVSSLEVDRSRASLGYSVTSIGDEVRGQIFSRTDSTPLVNAKVEELGTRNFVMTDAEGRFSIKLEERFNRLRVNQAGFVDQIIILEGNPQFTMPTFDRQAAPVEAKRKYIPSDGIRVVFLDEKPLKDGAAVPGLGKTAFANYLRDSLRYPSRALVEKKRGRVTVKFTVLEDGSTTNHKIVKGIGYGCDEEAIRLIKEGPVWQPAVKNGKVVESTEKVSIRFRPKK